MRSCRRHFREECRNKFLEEVPRFSIPFSRVHACTYCPSFCSSDPWVFSIRAKQRNGAKRIKIEGKSRETKRNHGNSTRRFTRVCIHQSPVDACARVFSRTDRFYNADIDSVPPDAINVQPTSPRTSFYRLRPRYRLRSVETDRNEFVVLGTRVSTPTKIDE